jgi:hypothetical protein
MKKIDKLFGDCFKLGTEISTKGKGASEIKCFKAGHLRQTELRLHGNLIARYEAFGKRKRTLSFSTCGWETQTTKHRLSACLDRGSIRSRNGKLWFCWAEYGRDPMAMDWISPVADGRPEPVPDALIDLENWN